MASMVQRLRDKGFDESRVIPFGGGWRPKCSQCQALVINGVPTHERGCPNDVHECKGCGNLVGRYQRYCEDCQ